MKAMVLEQPKTGLVLRDVPIPSPGPTQVLIKVHACGVCRTDLHVVDGDLTDPKLPIIPGHEIIGTVVETGQDVRGLKSGQRIGVPWLGHTCGTCPYCQADEENLCDAPGFTGYQIDGGYAQYTVADAQYCFALPDKGDPAALAPLMCAGLIGYRSYRMTGDAKRLGLYGFGAAAHILIQLAVHQGREVYAFSRPDDRAAQDFARALGATWAGSSKDNPPAELDAAIIFAPVGSLVPDALRAVRKGGIVVCAGIHMSDIPSFPYSILWEERMLRSVANLTRQDGTEFLDLAAKAPIKIETHSYPLAEANRALADLRAGNFNGAAVLVP
ncbi:zinc-dependent alcohol dehydrogenase family protein [Hoeflea prorocentri]|uniref:alcohol dehydrogenase n=1 Tax=Hoeflea prorocentri TaxID=1922333 RepID=A0A9X3UEL5_9HYPH|nr:zinc-dependent alcohol dehydrogenase family protein [Hoeflea prorocentri]MCY6379447.1 zinc-dependent alcohol dehydrogenase family protein [Hoeflea prorocentri]MDA5397248.1 zinc-dependent alcohol dehydrogenase family protein [Hoeflea prorocentri]